MKDSKSHASPKVRLWAGTLSEISISREINLGQLPLRKREGVPLVKANLVSLLFGSVLFTATFILLDRFVPFIWGYGSTRLISSNSLLISVIVSMTLAPILLGLWKASISPILSLLFCSILYFIQAYISIKYNFIGVSATFVEGVSEFQKFSTYFEFYVWKHSPIMTISLGMIILHITGRVRIARTKISV